MLRKLAFFAVAALAFYGSMGLLDKGLSASKRNLCARAERLSGEAVTINHNGTWQGEGAARAQARHAANMAKLNYRLTHSVRKVRQ